MPVGYLIGVLFVACGTLFALLPLRRPQPLSTVSFFFGLVFNELPFVAFYWLGASTLIAAAQGGIDTPLGLVAFALAVLTAFGLLVVVQRGLRARPALDRAMRQGLGTDWRADIDAGMSARLRRRRPWLAILLGPYSFRSRDVERVTDIRYGYAVRGNLLDLYRHRSHPPDAPTLVYVHGGSFVRGTKSREARALLYRLASQGWVCVSAEYRLGPATTFPDHLIDLKKVLAWVRAHSEEYGVDPTSVFVAGSSAGGHIAAMAALTPNDPQFQPGFEDADTSVIGAIGLYGFYGLLETTGGPPPSPLAYLGPAAPPFFVTHGDRDPLVAVEDARDFANRLRAASLNPVVYAELPGAHHSFDLFHSVRFEAVVDSIEAFAAWVRSRRSAVEVGPSAET